MPRALFNGITYRLIERPRGENGILCNAINRGLLNHEGSVSRHDIDLRITTPQVYRDGEALYATAVEDKRQWISKVWFMRDCDLIPQPVPHL